MTVTKLAQLTGYSISTVSKALSDSGEISRDAKEKILAVARETGYYDKAVRRKKRIGVPTTIGIVSSDIRDSSVLSRLCRAAREYSFEPVVCDSDNALFILTDVLGVDGIIFADGGIKECSVPCSAYRGSADNAIIELSELLSPTDKDTADTKAEKKEDIWLF